MSKDQKLGDRGVYDYTSQSGVVIPLRSLTENEAVKFLQNRSQWILNALVDSLNRNDQTEFIKQTNDVMRIVQYLAPNDKARKAAVREMREWQNNYNRRNEFVEIFTRILFVEMALHQGKPIPAQGEEEGSFDDDEDMQDIDPETAGAEKLEQLGEDLAAED